MICFNTELLKIEINHLQNVFRNGYTCTFFYESLKKFEDTDKLATQKRKMIFFLNCNVIVFVFSLERNLTLTYL